MPYCETTQNWYLIVQIFGVIKIFLKYDLALNLLNVRTSRLIPGVIYTENYTVLWEQFPLLLRLFMRKLVNSVALEFLSNVKDKKNLWTLENKSKLFLVYFLLEKFLWHLNTKCFHDELG